MQELDIHIVVVTFERTGPAHAYVQDSGLDWPLLVDDTRGLYSAYGMFKGTAWHLWGPPAWWAYAKELRRGRTPRLANIWKDTKQLGGDVLIDPSGTVRFLHVGRGPADRPSVATIVAARRNSP